jgi:hypothetical protein
MKRLSNRTIGVDQGTVTVLNDFESGGEMWTGTGPRERRTSVRFSEAFASIPAVHVSLSMLDIERRHNQRMDFGAENITREGFVIVFRTWEDTRVARARASWLAVGELACDDDWDVR